MKLILSGSGTRYPVFIGAIKAMRRHKARPFFQRIDEVLGVSGGAIVAAAVARGLDDEQLEKLVMDTLPGPLLDWNVLPSNSAQKGRFAGKKILEKLRDVLPSRFVDCKIPLHIVTYNVNRGSHFVWSGRGSVVDVPLLTRASMSLPFVFDPVLIQGELHIDGGVGANFPLDFFGTGRDVVGMRFRGQDPQKFIAVRSKFDLAGAVINGFIESTTREHVEDAMFARVMLLDTTNEGLTLDMGPADVKRMIAEGEDCAEKWLAAQR